MRSLNLTFIFLMSTLFAAGCRDNAASSNISSAPANFEMAAQTMLSETGLYQDMSRGTLSENIQIYAPRFELYSGILQKKRYILLPAGTPIIPINLELWQYPEGTKIWKEFSVLGDGITRKIETRLLEKSGDTWKVAAYIWNEEQSEAIRWGGQNGSVPVSIAIDQTTRHTVPSYSQCILCHNQQSSTPDSPGGEPVLGFTSFQLPRDYITELVEKSMLQEPSIPWQRHRTYALNTLERDVFGYLHANCGHCHNQRRTDMIPGVGNPTFTLNYDLETHSSRANTHLIKQIGKSVASPADPEFPSNAKLLVSGDPAKSMIFLRMNTASVRHRMPLVGIEEKDQAFIVSRLTPWIQRLTN